MAIQPRLHTRKARSAFSVIAYSGGIIIALFTGVLIGWGLRRSIYGPPYGDDAIRRFAQQSVRDPDSSIHVFTADGVRHPLEVTPSDRGAAMRDLILSLVPSEGATKEVLRHPNYELLYQTGHTPLVIYVRSKPPLLEFEIDGYVHLSNDGFAFERTIKKYTADEK